jgi:hypothetical protein
LDQVGARDQEPVLVPPQPAFRTRRSRLAADQDKERVRAKLALVSCGDVQERDLLELPIPDDARDLGARVNPDSRVLPAAVDQVLRHGIGKRRAANNQRDRARVLGGVDCGLAGRVRAADNEDITAAVEEDALGAKP